MFIRLQALPQYLAAFLQKQGLSSRASRFRNSITTLSSRKQPQQQHGGGSGGGGDDDDFDPDDFVVDDSMAGSGLLDHLLLRNEELIHSCTQEQFLYAAMTRMLKTRRKVVV